MQNDYFDYMISNAGNNQMPTLNRDIQQLNLASNSISRLKRAEFYRKKFRNLQKIYLNANQILHIDSSAFYKLTGLVELDLSENLISKFDEQQMNENDSSEDLRLEDFEDLKNKSSKLAEQTSGSERAKTFLQDLSQLRHLNLASNQLERIEKFTFAPLTQLTKLTLSR